MKQEKFNIKTQQKRRNLCIFINFKCNVLTEDITRFLISYDFILFMQVLLYKYSCFFFI